MITRTTPLAHLPELLRVPEAAAWLDVGESTVRGMVQRGELASVRLGRLQRIPKASLARVAGVRIDIAS